MVVNQQHDLDDLMTRLFTLTTEQLIERIASGEASTGDISNALKLLHQNGISVGKIQGSGLDRLEQVLPDLSELEGIIQ